MAIGGLAVGAIPAMWALTGITTIFFILRLYTRLVLLPAFSSDDYVFIVAYLTLLLMVVFYTKAATLGFGQSNASIGDAGIIAEATLWEAVGQSFTVLGTAIAKWSLGLFLLRLVIVRWQKVVIWIAMACVMCSSLSVLIAFWFQVSRSVPPEPCTPIPYLWDHRIPGGYCQISIVAPSQVLSCATVAVDFLFAIMPWFFIWTLQMHRQEKIVILASMSLGIIAGACGIVRATAVGGLGSAESLIEQSVTMICICVAVCRPIFKIVIQRIKPSQSSNPSNRTCDSRGFQLSSLDRSGGSRGDAFRSQNQPPTAKEDLELGMPRSELNVGTFPRDNEQRQPAESHSCARGPSRLGSSPGNCGDEGLVIRPADEVAHGSNVIHVTNEFRVTRT